jgi:serine/threonine protein kinase
LGRIVALKILPDELRYDATAVARFTEREMRALARCEHPNIVKIFTSGSMPDGRPYYTMEYVPGANLEEVWKELAAHSGQAPASHLGNSTLMRALHTASGKQRQVTESRYRSRAGSETARSSGQAGASTT